MNVFKSKLARFNHSCEQMMNVRHYRSDDLNAFKTAMQDAQELLTEMCDFAQEFENHVQFENLRHDIENLEISDIDEFIADALEEENDDGYDPIKEHGTWNRIGTGCK